IWAVDAMTLGPVTLTPGLRIEAIHSGFRDSLAKATDGGTYEVVLPGVSGYVAIARDFGVLAGVHEGFTPVPPAKARNGRPEKSINYEAGARYASRGLRIETIGFYDDYLNLTGGQVDAGHARIFGAETYAEADIALPRSYLMPLRASYTYTHT